jgi:hypothetical protein
MVLKPSTEGAVLVFDAQLLQDDYLYIQHYDGDLTSAMRALISSVQECGAQNRPRPDGIHWFQAFPRFDQLSALAHEGARPILRPNFRPSPSINCFGKLQHCRLLTWMT